MYAVGASVLRAPKGVIIIFLKQKTNAEEAPEIFMEPQHQKGTSGDALIRGYTEEFFRCVASIVILQMSYT